MYHETVAIANDSLRLAVRGLDFILGQVHSAAADLAGVKVHPQSAAELEAARTLIENARNRELTSQS